MKSAASASPGRPLLAGRILLYADDYVARWMGAQMGIHIIPPYTAFGVVSADGLLTGGVLFNNQSEADIELSIVAPKRLTRGLCRVIANYAFEQAGCTRMTARTRASSLQVRRVIEKVGFRQEGVLRGYYRDGEDAILFGMLRSECRW
jgi:RimJ/RimL family protein N-acetyltransferase